jgi:type II secretory pathway pseudopilin PulG
MRFMKKLKSNMKNVISSNDGLTMVEVIISFVIFMLALVMVTTSLRYALTTQDRYAERKEWINMLLVNMYAEKATGNQTIVYSKNNINFSLKLADGSDSCFQDVFSDTGGSVPITARYGQWNVKFDRDSTIEVFKLIGDTRIGEYSWFQKPSGDLKYYDYSEDNDANLASVSMAVYSPKK